MTLNAAKGKYCLIRKKLNDLQIRFPVLIKFKKQMH